MDSEPNPDGSEMPKWLQGKSRSELSTKGRIGFQGRDAGASVELRQIKWLRLSLNLFCHLDASSNHS
jgi:hypothetical protein